MFASKKSNGKAESLPGSLNLIGNGTIIKGNIETGGDLRIDGTLIGTLNGLSRVVLGESAIVEGDLFCKDADISGTIMGNISAEGVLTLKSTARVEGDLSAQRLIVEAGAIFTGNCKMKGGGPIQHVEKAENVKALEV
jgi:cytoskeletal protein CcmA (bactofilin family)